MHYNYINVNKINCQSDKSDKSTKSGFDLKSEIVYLDNSYTCITHILYYKYLKYFQRFHISNPNSHYVFLIRKRAEVKGENNMVIDYWLGMGIVNIYQQV
jgi:hypothetical protein